MKGHLTVGAVAGPRGTGRTDCKRDARGPRGSERAQQRCPEDGATLSFPRSAPSSSGRIPGGSGRSLRFQKGHGAFPSSGVPETRCQQNRQGPAKAGAGPEQAARIGALPPAPRLSPV